MITIGKFNKTDAEWQELLTPDNYRNTKEKN